ncbi:hypothetical protein [Pseudomonas protegens]|uniref:hypothetical protein n=1 Tax=Pseudomonas protegens TaxID=380021 RepID=UPI00381DF093
MIEILEKVPTEAWVTLFGVLLGSLLTILGVWLTNRSNEKQSLARMHHEEKIDNFKVRRERLEELYILVSSWHDQVMKEVNSFRRLIGRGEFERVEELFGKPFYDLPRDRVEMIVYMYGDKVRDTYHRAFEHYWKLTCLCRGSGGRLSINEYVEFDGKVESICDLFLTAAIDLKQTIVREARDI